MLHPTSNNQNQQIMKQLRVENLSLMGESNITNISTPITLKLFPCEFLPT